MIVVNQEIKAIKAVIIDLQTEREKRRQNQISERLTAPPTVNNHISSDESEPSVPNKYTLKPETSPPLPVVGQIKLIDKLNEDISKLQQEWSDINQQAKELEQFIPSYDVKNKYLDKAKAQICPQMAEYSRLKDHLQEQWSKLEVGNFHWSCKGDKEGWSRESIKPDFLKSSERKQWEDRGKYLVEFKERLTRKITINNKRLQDTISILNSPQGNYALETTRDNLIDTDFPHWSIAKDRKELMEDQLKSLWNEKCELEKLRNDLNTYYPGLNIGMPRKGDIRKRIRQPDILHLIHLIEQVKEKELTRKRQMAKGRR